MPAPVKPRRYDASRRRAAAADRRNAILNAARRLFAEQGYVRTTMPEIAHAAGVALDTVYDSVGKKPELFTLLIEAALSGGDEAVPVEKRDYVTHIRAEPDPSRKLELYAAALKCAWERIAPLVRAMQRGGAAEDDVAARWEAVIRRRARNMHLLIDDLQATGALRRALDPQRAGNTVWAVSSPEVYLLFTDTRGWSAKQYQAWLADTLKALLLG